MQIFGEAMQRGFELRMLTYLRANFPSASENSDEEILRIIRQGIDDASRYDIVTEADVQRYIKYMFIYGPDFDANPETARMGEILRTDVGGSKKMDRIDEYQLSVTRGARS